MCDDLASQGEDEDINIHVCIYSWPFGRYQCNIRWLVSYVNGFGINVPGLCGTPASTISRELQSTVADFIHTTLCEEDAFLLDMGFLSRSDLEMLQALYYGQWYWKLRRALAILLCRIRAVFSAVLPYMSGDAKAISQAGVGTKKPQR